MVEFTLPLADPAATLEMVGGKGASLAKLSRAGLPVPGGFHITTEAYRRFVADNRLQPHILDALRDADPAQPASLETASQKIGTLFCGAQIPAEIAAAISSAYAGMQVAAVAVRSSATAEDLPEASFAGQQETYLNIRGTDAVLEAVKNCWASLWTGRAIGYRIKNEIAQASVTLAVVVQELVPAEAAGVMFTANPLNGRLDEVVINAAWGLGEAIVSGAVTPDTLTVGKATGRLLQRATAAKLVMTIRMEAGTEDRPVPEQKVNAPVLSDRQAAKLAKVGGQIEALYERPMDIEWALAEGRFIILQARPITALPPEPVTWTTPGPGRWVHGTGSIEMIREPVSPLCASLIMPQFEAALRSTLVEFGMEDIFNHPLFQVVHGYVYACIALHLRMRHLPGILRVVQAQLFSSKGWEDELARYRNTVAGLECADLTALSAGELDGRVTDLVAAGLRYWMQVMVMVASLYQAEAHFTKFYERRVWREGDPDASIFLCGLEMRPLEADRALYALAQTAGEGGLEGYLQKYGYQISSFDPLSPTQADDPQPLLSAMEAYRLGKESPDARTQRMAAEREAATARILPRLSARSRHTFETVLAKAQSAAQLRENALFEVGRAWVPMRRDLLELGRRLVAWGAFGKTEDVFWLTDEELHAGETALDTGQSTPEWQGTEPVVNRVASRREQARNDVDLQPPYSLPVEKKPAFWWRWAFPMPELNEQRAADRLHGLGVSGGRVTAVARVLRGIEEAERLSPGEILVTRATTPAWTPLFIRAAGLVTDLGGPLSHGSIVAREFGIPAVMGTGSATQRIADGQTITLDGHTGEVLLQTRPLAGSAQGNISIPSGWPLPGKGPFMRSSIVDFLPDPLSPLFATLGRDRYNAGEERLMEWFIGDRRARLVWLNVINGYAYVSTSLSFWAGLRMLLAIPRMIKILGAVEFTLAGRGGAPLHGSGCPLAGPVPGRNAGR